MNTSGRFDFVVKPFKVGQVDGSLEVFLINFEGVIRKLDKFASVDAEAEEKN